jgi:transposase
MSIKLTTITMTNRDLQRLQVINRLLKQELVAKEVADLLNLSVRQIQRLKKKVKHSGVQGLVHGNRGRLSNRRLDDKTRNRIISLIKQNYSDFKPLLATEKLQTIHNISVSSETVRRVMIDEGLWLSKAKRESKQYHQYRLRKESRGDLIQFDGSYHHWFEDRAKECCLLASIDDATSEICLLFTEGEGVLPVFSFWLKYMQIYGKPRRIYVDRYSTYQTNNNYVSRLHEEGKLTQWQRAMRNLDISINYAHSPQAKGRIERLFNTLQDRLVKEMRLDKISDIESANHWLKTVFVPQFNQRFKVCPNKKTNLHQSLTVWEKQNLVQIFSIQKYRVLTNDYTLRYNNQYYQLAKKQPINIHPKDRILVAKRLNGDIKLSYQDHYLDYQLLPSKPKKEKEVVKLQPRISKPAPKNHPWRHTYIFKRKNNKCDISILQKV